MFKLDFKQNYVDVQADYISVIQTMQEFVNILVCSLPASLLSLRSGLDIPQLSQ